MLATLTAALPDRVPAKQRGALGGLIGISQMLGTVLGALMVTVIVTRLSAGYLACAVLVVAGALVFTVRTPDEPLPADFGRGAGRPRCARCGCRRAGTRTSAGRGSRTSWSTWATTSARCTCCTSSPTRRTTTTRRSGC